MGIVNLPRRFQTPTGQPAVGDGCFVFHPGNPFFAQGDITIGTPPCWRASNTAAKKVTSFDSGIPFKLPNQNFTVLCWAKPNTTTTTLAGGETANTGGAWLFKADGFSFRITGSFQTITYASTANTPYVYIARGSSGTGVEVFQNGTSVGSNANPIQTGTNLGCGWTMGDGLGSKGNCEVYLIAYWPRTLSLGEIQYYSANPSAVLIGQRRVSTVVTATGVTGSMNITESSVDVLAASGVVLVKGTANATEGTKDTFTSTGKVIVKGSFAATEGTVDVFTGSGTTTGGRVGTADMTESTVDSFLSSGTILVQGDLNATENTTDIFFATNVVPTTDKCVNSKWIVNMGSSSGAIQLQMASDVNGVDVTLKEGLFFLKYRKI